MKMVTLWTPSGVEHMSDMADMVRLAAGWSTISVATITSGYGDILRMKMSKSDRFIQRV